MKIHLEQGQGSRASLLYRTVSGAKALLLLMALAGSSLLSAGGIAHADSDAPTTLELKQMSLEQLLDIQVTSVARHPESLLQAAASIQVITREQIRRSGATSIPEALRLADNLEVAQKNSHDWAISARGFNTDLANKLLVMVDGRTVYTPLFSGVFWDVQDYLLEDIERIEVISGPGGTLWGANAVNGVINIITRNAADSQGLYVEGGGGTQPREFGGIRYGGTLAPDISFRVYGKYFDRSDEVYPDGARVGDNWHQERGGFRIDTDASQQNTFSLHGDFYEGSEGAVVGGTQQTSGGNLVFRWTDTFSDRSDLSLQSYYDHTHLLLPEPAAILNGFELAPPGVLHDDLTTYDIDFQHRFALAERNRVVWGLGYRFTHDVVQDAPSVGFLSPVLDHNLFSAFLQDEMRFATHWSLILGSKLEHNDYTGFEVEPNARLQWGFEPNETLWSAISRAARTPSRIDRELAEPAPPQPAAVAGSPKFGSEYVTAYELGYRGQVSSRLSGSLTTFYNDYKDVRSIGLTPVTLFPLMIENNVEGHTYGAELSATSQLLEWWSLHAGYNFLHESLHVKPGQFDIDNARNETADPKHQVSLRSSMNLPWHLDLDATVRWVDSLRTNDVAVVGEVPRYYELDTRIGWHLSRQLELALVGQNLLHAHHAEYGFPGPTQVQIERSVYGKIGWHY